MLPEKRKSFLLSKAVTVPDKIPLGRYDDTRGINIFGDQETALVLQSHLIGTESKTFAAPADDDPDGEAESCY